MDLVEGKSSSQQTPVDQEQGCSDAIQEGCSDAIQEGCASECSIEIQEELLKEIGDFEPSALASAAIVDGVDTHHDHPAPQHHEKDERYKEQQEHLQKWITDLQTQPDIETKLNLAISYMETALSQNGTPNFRHFWEIRKLCLDFFKEDMLAPTLRFQMWNKYIELSKEARRLKDILDEQSAFAAEQIDIAVQALEHDIAHLPDLLQKSHPLDLSMDSKFLDGEKLGFYKESQRELNFLNVYASRINALRKELIKTDMRIRHKNKLFQRLSAAGDLIFPKRKEMIRVVSQHFIEDVESFIKVHFSQEEIHQPLFFLRDEIKALQSLAKMLTLNTLSFTQTRMRLSECWDKIKLLEKERKKERAQHKIVSKAHIEQIQQKLKELETRFLASELTAPQGFEELENISSFMRSQKLGYDELKDLREELGKVRRLLTDKVKYEEQAKQNQEKERDRAKQEMVISYRTRMESLLKEAEGIEIDALLQRRDALLSEVETSTMSRSEKQELEKMLRPLRDLIADKKKKKLLALSDDDQQALAQLHTMLDETKQRRQEIRDQLEVLRKASGSSGFDFNQAMIYNEQLSQEKQLLENVNQSIKELEQKIDELES